MNKRWIATTNAPVPGEGSVAEAHHDGYDKMIAGLSMNNDLLFDTREVVVENIYDPEEAKPALRYVYGDAMDPETGWVDFDAIWSRVNSPLTKESVARRFYFNQRTTGDSNWLHKVLWVACENQTTSLKFTDKIALGFKGNTKRGAAIVACRLTDKALFSLGWWENDKEKDDYEVPFTQVDAKIRKILANYPVYKLLADPTQYQDVVGRWHSDFQDEVEEFWLANKTKMAKAVEQFESAVYSKRTSWKDASLSRHILNCHVDEVPGAPRDDGSPGQVVRQENKHSFRYIFGAQAAVLAVEAAVIAIEEGALNESDGTLYIF